MVFGWNNDDLDVFENDEGSNRATGTRLVVDERNNPIQNSSKNQVVGKISVVFEHFEK